MKTSQQLFAAANRLQTLSRVETDPIVVDALMSALSKTLVGAADQLLWEKAQILQAAA